MKNEDEFKNHLDKANCHRAVIKILEVLELYKADIFPTIHDDGIHVKVGKCDLNMEYPSGSYGDIKIPIKQFKDSLVKLGKAKPLCVTSELRRQAGERAKLATSRAKRRKGIALKMREEGKTFKAIGEHLGVSGGQASGMVNVARRLRDKGWLYTGLIEGDGA